VHSEEWAAVALWPPWPPEPERVCWLKDRRGCFGGAAVRPEWLDGRKEPVLEAELPIIDPHHHLWIRPGSRYLVDDLLADMNSGHNILATVYVQARSMYRPTGPLEMRPIGETEFVNGVAAMFASGLLGHTRACAAIVGQADLTLGSRAIVFAKTRQLRALLSRQPRPPLGPIRACVLNPQAQRRGRQIQLARDRADRLAFV